ncbi:hypothetical protein [Rhizobium lusitanum]|uniref:hypothetical protein n=1 Tax=Rhizobium lusitanum TaxID=293958 RepID=UPI0015716600|nr:hypothetical protein [Rhizobium lusitanum]NTJ11778.1 hypothetical protein [Rhizobium lusitanum]
MTDSALQTRRIGVFRQLLVAAPEVAASITSNNPDDLVAAPFIANTALREPLIWQFNEDDFNRHTVRIRPAMTMNTTPSALSATLAGVVKNEAQIGQATMMSGRNEWMTNSHFDKPRRDPHIQPSL